MPTGLNHFLIGKIVYTGSTAYWIIGVLLFFVIYPWLKSKKKTYHKLSQGFSSRAMIYISSLIFSIAHWAKAGEDLLHFWLYIPFLFPYFLSGLIFAHARLKHGFAFAFMSHSLFNLLIVILNLLTS
ncbi:CPBP family glutamic-type intramembrane protease [Fulvivirga kasyanovii]